MIAIDETDRFCPDAERSQNGRRGCPGTEKGGGECVAGAALEVFDEQRIELFEHREEKSMVLAEGTR